VWRSDDKGKTWKLMSNNDNRPMFLALGVDEILFALQDLEGRRLAVLEPDALGA